MMLRYKWEHLVDDAPLRVPKKIWIRSLWQPTVDDSLPSTENGHCSRCYSLLEVYFYEDAATWAWWCDRCEVFYFFLGDVVQCAICLQQNAKNTP